MLSNSQYFEPPIKTKNKNPVACPYVKVPNLFKNVSGVPQPNTLSGEKLNEVCVPNLSDNMLIPGYGLNLCIDNKPKHINFYDSDGTVCYKDNVCSQELQTCYEPVQWS